MDLMLVGTARGLFGLWIAFAAGWIAGWAYFESRFARCIFGQSRWCDFNWTPDQTTGLLMIWFGLPIILLMVGATLFRVTKRFGRR
jgi:hypothetical protein